MSSWSPTKYQTKNWPSYNMALKQRGSLSIWFDPEMIWVPPPNGKRGGQQDYSDAAIQACLTLKVLFGMPLRQTTGFVESLLRLIGLDWAVPDSSTLSRRQKTLHVTLPYRGGTGPLNLLIDSTGIKAEGEGEWNARKHGGSKRRVWRKIHIGIDEETLEVRAIEVTTSNVGDAPMLPELLDQFPADIAIGSVTADGACDTRKCHDAIAARPSRACGHPAAQERQTLEAHQRRCHRPQRSGQCLTLPGPRHLATVERIPPPKPCRNQDALHQAPRPIRDGAGLRPAGRRNPNPRCRAKSLHSSGHTCHRARRISLSGERGTALKTRSVQQSPFR